MKYEIDHKKAISNAGNRVRLKKLLKRALGGENLTIGFLGGSITQGSLSSTPETCYAYLVYDWFCKTFPNNAFTFVNAGIGATDSQFGCARAESDLLSYHPDFVALDFSVNDEPNEHYMETYEGVVRKILYADSAPALVLLHNVFYDSGKNAQVYHGRVARYYDVPAVSMQSSLYPEILAGRIENREVTPDDLHPNDAGHEIVASMITGLLEDVLEDIQSLPHVEKEDEEPCSFEKKNPMTTNAYENSIRIDNRNADEIGKAGLECMQGFVKDTKVQTGVSDCFKNGWLASDSGAEMVFRVKGSGIAVQYRKTPMKPAPVATLILDGDEEHPFFLDANFDETWGDKLQLDTILEHGEDKEHEIRISITETHAEDQKPFMLVGILVSAPV